jgi:hypothetical protein
MSAEGQPAKIGRSPFVMAAAVLEFAETHCRYSRGDRIMRVRKCVPAILCLLGTAAVVSSAHALTQDEILAKLESAGYSQIRQIPTGKIKSFRAVKNGKEVSIIVDSTGHIKELQ